MAHLQEVLVTPVGAVAVRLPLLVHMQQREVVRLGHKELLARRIALLRAASRGRRGAAVGSMWNAVQAGNWYGSLRCKPGQEEAGVKPGDTLSTNLKDQTERHN